MNANFFDILSLAILISIVAIGFLLLYLYKKSGSKPPVETAAGLKFKMPLLNQILHVYSIVAWLSWYGIYGAVRNGETGFLLIAVVFALIVGAYIWYSNSRTLTVSGDKLTFRSLRGSTTIEWNDIKKISWGHSFTSLGGIIIETTEGTFFFHRGWLGLHHFVQQAFEKLPWGRIGTKDDLKPFLEPKHG